MSKSSLEATNLSISRLTLATRLRAHARYLTRGAEALSNSTPPHALLFAALMILQGCTQLAGKPPTNQVKGELLKLQNQIAKTQDQLSKMQQHEYSVEAEMAGQISALMAGVESMGNEFVNTCRKYASPVPSTTPQECETTKARVVVADSGKLLLGEIEHLWIAEPGFTIITRVDTGASSSSLHATELTEFERDGKDWVRFNVAAKDEQVTLERPVEKYVRVFQQADKNGSRRPVVALRIRLGDVQDTFEFTLADRSHLQHNMILGRNFLTDIAIVDVSQKYIQPSP